jgi:2-dehydropantoate 2-reductase
MTELRCNIAVVGAGAIGCYFGGLLARGGHAVTLIGRLPQVDAINKSGLQFESLGQRQRITIAATDRIAVVADAAMVLFCVKSSDTENAARAMAPHLAPEAIVLSLQNGVDNVERIRAHTKNPVLPVLVYAAAQIPAPGSVQHTGGGNLVIGSDLPREIADVDQAHDELRLQRHFGAGARPLRSDGGDARGPRRHARRGDRGCARG